VERGLARPFPEEIFAREQQGFARLEVGADLFGLFETDRSGCGGGVGRGMGDMGSRTLVAMGKGVEGWAKEREGLDLDGGG